MKALKVMMVVLAVGLFSVSAFGQEPGDTCDTALAANDPLNLCLMSVGLTDLEGDGGYDNCWGGNGQRDAWVSFVATDTQARIRTDLSSIETDSHFEVYSGDCAAMVEIGCSEDEVSAGWYGDICVETTPGETYHVQLGTYAVDHDGYGPSYNFCNYYTSLTFGVSVGDKYSDKSGEYCGDTFVNSPCEECEADSDCPPSHICNYEELDCKCTSVVPMLPVPGLVGLGVLLVAGGALVFGRRRK